MILPSCKNDTAPAGVVVAIIVNMQNVHLGHLALEIAEEVDRWKNNEF